ncbi:hypothetical protein F0344_26930 [Streptomyces finlayi]|uniref:Ribosomal RNA large subunit methyltransferase K/L-like methyltransferase domain-containing protein n=1 Tax=Streptomyces finlayi TaxID=67296 RepID=A0A7G7BVT8_9ACTN|nr:hypothetical protein F0344_26930 [Streptomyces finlayi]
MTRDLLDPFCGAGSFLWEAGPYWNQVRLTIMGITQFLCSQVALELKESASRAVREGTWDDLAWELVAFDD